MGTSSYVLVGKEAAMRETFGSCCHGAGRSMSRTKAKQQTSAGEVLRELAERGVLARAQTTVGLTEEKPGAYKNVDAVVEVVHRSGLAGKVAKLKPIGVIKG
jgi:tRNA-splicing ligase RtcB